MKKKIQIQHDEIVKCYALSKMLPIEEMNQGPKSYDSLEFVEFLEFIVRVADLIDGSDDSLTQKLDGLLMKLLDQTFREYAQPKSESNVQSLLEPSQ